MEVVCISDKENASCDIADVYNKKLHNPSNVVRRSETRYPGISGVTAAIHKQNPSKVNSCNSPIRQVNKVYMFTNGTSTAEIQ